MRVHINICLLNTHSRGGENSQKWQSQVTQGRLLGRVIPMVVMGMELNQHLDTCDLGSALDNLILGIFA